MNETRKLYRFQLKGMKGSFIGTCYGMPYVVATNPTDAYKIVREYLDREKIGFLSDREMDSIALLAEEGDYPIRPVSAGHIILFPMWVNQRILPLSRRCHRRVPGD